MAHHLVYQAAGILIAEMLISPARRQRLKKDDAKNAQKGPGKKPGYIQKHHWRDAPPKWQDHWIGGARQKKHNRVAIWQTKQRKNPTHKEQHNQQPKKDRNNLVQNIMFEQGHGIPP
jgi:hypothetical protein